MQSADKHIQLFVSTKGPATIKNHSWMDSTVGDDLALITLSSDHPYFCTDCSYYIGVYSLDAEEEEHPIDVEVAVECPDGVCLSCDTGYDPATNCQDCLPGYFGATCEPCKGCAHGTCDSGKQGSGKCVCEEGWGPEDVCNECKAGFWGLQCEACPSCHGHGQCSDGIDGTGQCVCEGNWDPRVDCEDCIAGFWGAACMGECPRNEEGLICSGHGKCNDKDFGNGRCTCEDGMVGIKCDTKKEEDKCSPPCSELHGACDEEQGVCVCYDGYKGKTCERSQNVMVIIVGVAVVVLILIGVVFFIVNTTKNTTKGRKKRSTKDALLESVEWSVCCNKEKHPQLNLEQLVHHGLALLVAHEASSISQEGTNDARSKAGEEGLYASVLVNRLRTVNETLIFAFRLHNALHLETRLVLTLALHILPSRYPEDRYNPSRRLQPHLQP